MLFRSDERDLRFHNPLHKREKREDSGERRERPKRQWGFDSEGRPFRRSEDRGHEDRGRRRDDRRDRRDGFKKRDKRNDR